MEWLQRKNDKTFSAREKQGRNYPALPQKDRFRGINKARFYGIVPR
jgi:hypothetical protein